MIKANKLIVFYLSQEACYEYSKAIIEYSKDINFTLVLNKRNRLAKETASNKITLPSSRLGLILCAPNFILKIFFFFLKQKKHNQLSAISLSFHPYNYLISIISKILGINFVLTVHDYTTHLGEKNSLLESIQKSTIRKSYATLFLSEHERNIAVSDGLVLERTYLVPHPVYEYAGKHSLPHAAKLQLLYYGRSASYKGLRMLEQLASLACVEHITIAGKDVKKFIHSEEAKIRLMDQWLEEEDIDKLILEHHVLILPYREASQSGVLAKGFSYGIPMLISRVGGLPEQISDRSAIWFDGSVDQAIRILEDLAKDPEQYNELRNNMAAEHIHFQQQWIKAYQEFITYLMPSSNS